MMIATMTKVILSLDKRRRGIRRTGTVGGFPFSETLDMPVSFITTWRHPFLPPAEENSCHQASGRVESFFLFGFSESSGMTCMYIYVFMVVHGRKFGWKGEKRKGA